MVIPQEVSTMLQQPTLIALATCSQEAIPNVAYMLQYWWLSKDEIVIGDLFMKATRENVEENEQVSLCAWDKQSGHSYKLKGTAQYETSGPAYDLANENLHKKKPDKNFKGVVTIKITEVYDASRGENAGKLMAQATG